LILGEEQFDLVVVSGDFTHRAKVKQYRQASDFLQQISSIPTIVTPGNHDVPLYRLHERLFRPYALYRRWIHPELNYLSTFQSARLGQVAVLSLNSTAPYRRIDGHLTGKQLDLLAATGQDSSYDIRILVLHHPIVRPMAFDRNAAIWFEKDVLSKILDSGFNLVLTGHLHCFDLITVSKTGELTQLTDSPISMSTTPIQLVNIFTGTASSTRGRSLERFTCSYNILTLEPAEELGLLHLTLQSFSKQLNHPNFVETRSHTLKLSGELSP
jgi:3',5'-cyclic AMP phosphodiesterase CpdA